jgi:hypothetical protein
MREGHAHDLVVAGFDALSRDVQLNVPTIPYPETYQHVLSYPARYHVYHDVYKYSTPAHTTQVHVCVPPL